jgi:hypothetical protein
MFASAGVAPPVRTNGRKRGARRALLLMLRGARKIDAGTSAAEAQERYYSSYHGKVLGRQLLTETEAAQPSPVERRE